MPPEPPDAEPNVQVNSYGWHIAEILPTPRTFVQQQDGTIRPVPTYPPNFARESTEVQTVNKNAQRITSLPIEEPEGIYPQKKFVSEELQYPIMNDIRPRVIHLPTRNAGGASANFGRKFQQVTQYGFPFNILHSTNVLLMPVIERQNFRLFPTDFPMFLDFVTGAAALLIKSHWRNKETISVLPLTRKRRSEIVGCGPEPSEMDLKPRCLSSKRQDCRGHRDAMGPECTNKKINNNCNTPSDFKDSFISHVIYLFVNLLSQQGLLAQFHLIKLVS